MSGEAVKLNLKETQYNLKSQKPHWRTPHFSLFLKLKTAKCVQLEILTAGLNYAQIRLGTSTCKQDNMALKHVDSCTQRRPRSIIININVQITKREKNTQMSLIGLVNI